MLTLIRRFALPTTISLGAISFGLITAAAPGAAPGSVRPSGADIAALSTPSDVVISPDGGSIVYALTTRTFDPEAKPAEKETDGGWKTDKQLFIVRRIGARWGMGAALGEPAQLTFGEEKAGSARWSPDGSSIAFLRERDGKATLHVLNVSGGGGEARPIDTGDLAPETIDWSPDGAFIAFTAKPEQTKEEKDEKWRTGGAVKWDREWRSAQLYVVPAMGGDARRVTTGNEHISGFEWSPEGGRFVVQVSATSRPYDVFNTAWPRVISAKDGSVIRELEPATGTFGAARWSPDGTMIAYPAGVNSLSLLNHLRVREVNGSGVWNAAESLDPTIDSFAWSADSSSLIAHVLERTKSRLYRLPAKGGPAAPIGFEGRVILGGLHTDQRSNSIACLTTTVRETPDPTVIDVADGRAFVAARVNPQVREWSLGEGELVRWTSPEGMEIEGLLVKTAHPPATGAPPLMVLPHGGPDSVTSERWSGWAHFFAARGFNVLMPNYRGGTGYGHAFYAANRGRLGEIEFMDIESGVDALIKAGKADPERLVFGGWSWGGYLTAWTIGHTGRYRGAVVGAGVMDVVSMYCLSDINHGAAAEWEYKGNPWRQFENFDRSNPMRSIANATTPTLIIHGEGDDRVPYQQAIMLHRALSDVGCEVEMLGYPREPHGFQEPAHSAHMLEAWAEWYDRHLTP